MHRQLFIRRKAPELKEYYQQFDNEALFDAETIATFRLKVYQIIQNFPPKRKEIFLLHYFQSLKNREIAARLGISVKAVEKQKTLALKELRAEMGPRDQFIFTMIFL